MKIVSFLVSCFLLAVPLVAHSQESTGVNEISPCLINYKAKWEFGTEYMTASTYTNHFYTVNINALYWKKYFKKAYLNMQVGLTATYAVGTVSRLELNNGQPETYLYSCKGAGIGPVIQFQPIVFKRGPISLEAQVSGAWLVYNKPFPYGGLFYNFMFRPGASICCDVNAYTTLRAGYRWIHVSNGTGTGIQNPYYEGKGFGISFTRYMQ